MFLKLLECCGKGGERMDNLPAFPTVDLKPAVDWMVTGFTGLVTSNAGLVVTAGLLMALVPLAIIKVKGFAKKAVK